MFVLKTATVKEIPQILELIHDGIKFWAGEDYPHLRQWYDETYTYAYIAKRIEAGSTIVAFEETKPTIVQGTINLNHVSSEEAYLGSLYCRVKKQGLGTLLLENALSLAVNKDYKEITCNVFEHNLVSRNLMMKYGAKFVNRETYGGYNYDIYHFMLKS